MQRWDAHTHEDILLALFQHVKIPTSDIQKVMGELRAKGYTFTENALRYNSLFGFVCFCLFACFSLCTFAPAPAPAPSSPHVHLLS
jgi:hypothetical protein